MEVKVELEATECATCGTVFAMTAVAMRSRASNHGTFFCPNGHSLSFPAKTEAEKLRAENRGLRDQLDAINQEIYDKRERMAKARAARKGKHLRAVS